MLKLDFVVPGFSKCGTTTLCDLLDEHPDIAIAEGKEPNFFAEGFHYGWDWYEAFFRHARPGQLLGDGSTFYSAAEFAEISCRRILDCSPDCRFIFIARNPISRLESSFREQHSSGYKYGVHADFSIGQTLLKWPNMLADTMYWKLINVYRQHVPDERILVLFLEDFQRAPELELRRCFEFLHVATDARIAGLNRRSNSGATKLYDTRTMRYIRSHAWSARLWNMMGSHSQERVACWLRLRKPFTKAVEWDSRTAAWVCERLEQDTQQFLRFYGKPATFWNLNATGASQPPRQQAA